MREVTDLALNQIEAEKLQGEIVQTTVVYERNPDLLETPHNPSIQFYTEFIKTQDRYMLHRIAVTQ